MTEAPLTAQNILDAAEDVLTRYGPAKTTVLDVARALGVSHGSVYRHFESKAALRDAVTERWLARLAAPLARIVAEDDPAPERLRRWFDKLIAVKRQKARVEPELFATYREIFAESREVVQAHIETLASQVGAIIADGIKRGEFAATDPIAAGRAIFFATARFHDPKHAADWTEPGQDAVFEDLWSLLMLGLTPRPAAKRR